MLIESIGKRFEKIVKEVAGELQFHFKKKPRQIMRNLFLGGCSSTMDT
jgi:hypothetical protein